MLKGMEEMCHLLPVALVVSSSFVAFRPATSDEIDPLEIVDHRDLAVAKHLKALLAIGGIAERRVEDPRRTPVREVDRSNNVLIESLRCGDLAGSDAYGTMASKVRCQVDEMANLPSYAAPPSAGSFVQ